MLTVHRETPVQLTHLNPNKILETSETLSHRISERFPDSGLSGVCDELALLAGHARLTCTELRKPNWVLRLAIGSLFVFAAGALVGGIILGLGTRPAGSTGLTWTDAIQVAEAAINDVLLIGAGLYFFLSFERRRKRARVARALNQLRTLAHLIDVHQLTKSPDMAGDVQDRTASSPKRMGRFQMGRYLDYCSEMLALTSVIAALYGDGFGDSDAVALVTQVEELCNALQRKIWQKMILLRGRSLS